VTNKYLGPYEYSSSQKKYTIWPSTHQLETNKSFEVFYGTLAVIFPINIVLGFILFFSENNWGAKLFHPFFAKVFFPLANKIASLLEASTFPKISKCGQKILREVITIEEDEDAQNVIQREADPLQPIETTEKKQKAQTSTTTATARLSMGAEADESLEQVELQPLQENEDQVLQSETTKPTTSVVEETPATAEITQALPHTKTTPPSIQNTSPSPPPITTLPPPPLSPPRVSHLTTTTTTAAAKVNSTIRGTTLKKNTTN
jgi:hypothetical protein